MRPYSRPAWRPYPRVERARNQIKRGRLPQCPRCHHSVPAHAFDESGQRVCTRGAGRISCRECARTLASLTEPARAMLDLAQALRLGGSRDVWKSLVLSP